MLGQLVLVELGELGLHDSAQGGRQASRLEARLLAVAETCHCQPIGWNTDRGAKVPLRNSRSRNRRWEAEGLTWQDAWWLPGEERPRQATGLRQVSDQVLDGNTVQPVKVFSSV